jgi:catechol 2,3-dioxygenase-like lactoylglutathione lyase family enzyme
MNHLRHITVLVKDQEEALKFYTEKLGFIKRENQLIWMDTIRWLAVSPKNQKETLLSLVKAEPEDEHLVGHQSGNHVFMTILTDDVEKDYTELKERGVNFPLRPESQSWGIEAVFEDLYGNRFDLIQRPKNPPAENKS